MEGSKNPATRELTGEETAIYDRQIRLWGLDAQRRLAASKVLITGDVASVLAQELAKNLVLAGILGVTLSAAKSTSLAALGFLGEDVGKIAESLRAINPLVDIRVLDGRDACEHPVGGYSLVCAVGATAAHERATGVACRASGVPFMCGRTAGAVGLVFADLGADYKYARATARAAQAAAGDGDAADETEEAVAHFVSYEDALAARWGDEPRRSECGWHAACCLRAFEERHGRMPGDGGDGDVEELVSIYGDMRAAKGAKQKNEKMIRELGKTACYGLGPVAAVVGGMWGREAIKAFSRRDEPVNNFYFFSARTSQGTVEKVGSIAPTPEGTVVHTEAATPAVLVNE